MKELKYALPERLVCVIDSINSTQSLQEIRIRIHQPIIFYINNEEYFLSNNYTLSKRNLSSNQQGRIEDIREVMAYISKYSLYAYEEDVRNGFITIEGGHRVGLAGKVVLDQGKVKTIRNITCVNIRVCHQIIGCANGVLPYLFERDNLCHTLIISPPKCGKTTLLRDIVRQISDGTRFMKGLNVGLIDERSEIAACYKGVPQNNVGIRTDILDSCTKGEGMMMLLRAMAPDVLALDEIGCREEIDTIDYVLNSGCKLICTVHGQSLDEIKEKPKMKQLMARKIFKRYIVLENQYSIGDVIRIFNEEDKLLCVQKNNNTELAML